MPSKTHHLKTSPNFFMSSGSNSSNATKMRLALVLILLITELATASALAITPNYPNNTYDIHGNTYANAYKCLGSNGNAIEPTACPS